MKSLIRFEDTYGMTDIFCASRGIDYYDTNLIRKIHKIDDETYISFGFGNVSCLSPTYYEIAQMESIGIDRILFVIDVDRMSGDKTSVLSYDELQRKIRPLQNLLNSHGCKISLEFIIITYAAETIMLYQYLSNKEDNAVERNVHKINTTLLHLILLAALEKEPVIQKAKRVRNFLNIETLKRKIVGVKSINTEVFDWILSECVGCYGYTLDETHVKLDNINRKFEKYITSEPRHITLRLQRSNSIEAVEEGIDLNDRLYDIARKLNVKIR